MTWTLRVDRRHQLVYIRMFDRMSFRDIAATQDALRIDPDFDPDYPLLLDARGAKVQPLTQQDMLSLAENTPLAPGTKVAIVVDDPRELERVRDYEFIRELDTETDATRACQTIDEAVAWLGVDPPLGLSG
jgi:hypothetical protein